MVFDGRKEKRRRNYDNETLWRLLPFNYEPIELIKSTFTFHANGANYYANGNKMIEEISIVFCCFVTMHGRRCFSYKFALSFTRK